jgi:hypothetical protein
VDRGGGNWKVYNQERAFCDEVPVKRALRLPGASEDQYESGKQGEKGGEASLETEERSTPGDSIVDLCAGGSGSRRRGPGLYARADPAIPIAPLQILPFLVRKAV